MAAAIAPALASSDSTYLILHPRCTPATMSRRHAEEPLIRRAAAGEEAAWTELYTRYEGFVRKHVSRIVPYDAVDDVVQDTFLKAWQKIAQFRFESGFSTWLHTIARRQALMWRRREDRKGSLTISLNDQVGDTTLAEDDCLGNPGGDVDSVPARLDIERGMDGLPPGFRVSVQLHDVEGYEHQEIAEMLGRSEGCSKSQLTRARRKLRKLMGGRR